MIALESEGWVSIEPHRGAFVHGLDVNSVRDHYALLGQLYGLAAERATERGDDQGLEALAAAERLLRVAHDPESVLHANEAFLRQIFVMAHSPRLSSFGRLMTGVIPGNFFELVPGTVEPQKRGIEAVNHAVKESNGKRAAAEFVQMLRGHGDLVVDLLQSRHILWAVGEQR